MHGSWGPWSKKFLFSLEGGGGAGIGHRVYRLLEVLRAERSDRDQVALIPVLSLCPLVSLPLYFQDGESLVVPSHKGPSPWVEGGQGLAPRNLALRTVSLHPITSSIT